MLAESMLAESMLAESVLAEPAVARRRWDGSGSAAPEGLVKGDR
jgi:hypothetical protein